MSNSHTYATLQQVFSAINSALPAVLGYSANLVYQNQIEESAHQPPKSIIIIPEGYKYAPAVASIGNGRRCLGRQIHSFQAIFWGSSEDETWALEGAFSLSLLKQTKSSARVIEGGWVPAANSQYGRVLSLTFEVDVPLLDVTPLTTTVEHALPTASS